jgi:hypothetical protein
VHHHTSPLTYFYNPRFHLLSSWHLSLLSRRAKTSTSIHFSQKDSWSPSTQLISYDLDIDWLTNC